MKKRLALILAVLLDWSLIGCARAAQANTPLDWVGVFYGPVREAVIFASGEKAVLTDEAEPQDLLSVIRGIDFYFAGKDDSISAPGAVSVTVTLMTETESMTITFPMWEYNGQLYAAAGDSIQRFQRFLDTDQ